MLRKKKVFSFEVTNPQIEWKLGAKLGDGTFGDVYEAINSDGAKVAAKICEIEHEEDYIDMQQEAKILSTCNHPNVLKAIVSYYYDKKIWMMLELCSGGALDFIMEKMKGLDERTIKAFTFQCLHGLEYLHSKLIIHRDIKAANIMLTENGICKIADFGISAVLSKPDDRRNTFIGSTYWMAPEIFLTQTHTERNYDEKVDIFSLGITVIEAERGLPPDDDHPPAQVSIIRIKSPPPTFANPAQWSIALNQFVAMTVQKNPESRPTATQCLDLEYFKGMDITNNEALIELYNIRMAFDEGVEEEVLPDDEYDSEDTSTYIQNEPNSLGNIHNLRTIKRTIKYKIDGVEKHRTILKMVDSNNVDEKELKKVNLEKMLNQINRFHQEERRQLKKLEAAQQAELHELISRLKSDLDRSIEKYNTECESHSKIVHKEIEKKRAILKLDIEKVIKNSKFVLDKEIKIHEAALSSKKKSKYPPCFYDDNYISDRTISDQESHRVLLDKHNRELSKFYTIIMKNKNDKLLEILKNLIVNALRNLYHVFSARRKQIHAKMDLAVQSRFKMNEKESANSLKFLSDKLEQKFREHERARRDLPKQQRIIMKKEMDTYKKKIKKLRSKHEKELLNKRNIELMQVFESEINVQKKQQEEECKEMEESNERQMREMYEYQDRQNSTIHKSFQNQLYQRYLEEESEIKSNLTRMYCLVKTREQEFQMEIHAAKTTKIEGFANIIPTMF